VADRDPEVIKAEIDDARERLAATVDTLAERANPQRIANDAGGADSDQAILPARLLTPAKPAAEAGPGRIGLHADATAGVDGEDGPEARIPIARMAGSGRAVGIMVSVERRHLANTSLPRSLWQSLHRMCSQLTVCQPHDGSLRSITRSD